MGIQRYARWRTSNDRPEEDEPGRHLFGTELKEAIKELRVGVMRREDYVRCPKCKCCEDCSAFSCVPNKLCCADFMDKHLDHLHDFTDLIDMSKVKIERWSCGVRWLKRSLWVFIPLSCITGCVIAANFCCDDGPKNRAISARSGKDIEEGEASAASPSAAASQSDDNDHEPSGSESDRLPHPIVFRHRSNSEISLTSKARRLLSH